MKKKPGKRAWGRIGQALILLALLVSACNYQTIGGVSSIKKFTPTAATFSKSLPTTSKGKQQPQAQQGTPTLNPKSVQCRLSNLTPSATWNVTGQGLAGSLTLTNYWPTACTLVGMPALGLTDDNGQPYPLKVTAPTPSPNPPIFLFNENTVGEIRFTWSNWCGPAPKGAMRVSVTMARQTVAALYVIVEDGNGNPLSDVPPCTDKSKSSTLIVQDLRILN